MPLRVLRVPVVNKAFELFPRLASRKVVGLVMGLRRVAIRGLPSLPYQN